MDLTQITEETLELVRKAAATNGVLASSGIQGVDLSGLVSLVPVNVPARNNTSAFPRKIAGMGAATATWRALLNINNQQPNPAVGLDFAGALVKVQEQDVFAPFQPLAEAGRVTLDAVALARNYADALAVAELQTLNQLFIGQDIHIINSQAWGLGAPAAPTLAAGSGGSLPAVALYVKVAARSGFNYFYGDNSPASAASTVTPAASGSVTASLPALKGAVAYDWYVGASATALYYYTTTTTASVTITSVPTADSTVPSLPLISSAVPTGGNGGSGPATDTSYSLNNYNGVIASSLGDYGSTGPVRPGSGNSSGATFIDNGGNALSASGSSIPLLDQINESLWESVQLSPNAYMVNSKQAEEIADLLLGTNAAITFLPPTDGMARTNLAGGGYVGQYINKSAGGVPVAIEVHPHLAPGTIIARTDRVPFPGSNIGNVFQVRCQYDTMRFDYAANYNPGVSGGGPRYDFEIRSMETLVNAAPVAQAVATNIA